MGVAGGFNHSEIANFYSRTHIAILLGWFLELPTNRLHLDPRTPYLSQKYFGKYKNNTGPCFKTIFHIWESENLKCWKVCAPNFLNFWTSELLFLTFWNVEPMMFELWDFWNFETLLFRKFEILETWNFDILEFWDIEDGHREMMKIPANKSSKSWIWISYLSKNNEMETC